VLKPQIAINELKLYSTNIICPSIIHKYFNYPNHYESLSLLEYCSFYNINNNKNLKCDKPKIIKFLNYNKHTYVENRFKERLFLYSPIFGSSQNSQFGTNVTWNDTYCQLQVKVFETNIISTTKCHTQIQRNRLFDSFKIKIVASN
jgi:hypothetical protein